VTAQRKSGAERLLSDEGNRRLRGLMRAWKVSAEEALERCVERAAAPNALPEKARERLGRLADGKATSAQVIEWLLEWAEMADARFAPVRSPGAVDGVAALVLVGRVGSRRRWVRVGEAVELEPGRWTVELRVGDVRASVEVRADVDAMLAHGYQLPEGAEGG
jgi:hypothetical protein